MEGLYYEDDAAGVAHGAVTVSDNGGATWSSPIDIPNPSGAFLDAETDVIQLTSGNLWAIQRSSHSPAQYSTSTDLGNTWSDSQSLGFVAQCPYLLRTEHENLILMAYRGYNTLDGSGTGFTALRYSLDECATWSDPIVVDTTVGAYPSMVNLNDGSVLITYYEEGAGSNIRARTIDDYRPAGAQQRRAVGHGPDRPARPTPGGSEGELSAKYGVWSAAESIANVEPVGKWKCSFLQGFTLVPDRHKLPPRHSSPILCHRLVRSVPRAPYSVLRTLSPSLDFLEAP